MIICVIYFYHQEKGKHYKTNKSERESNKKEENGLWQYKAGEWRLSDGVARKDALAGSLLKARVQAQQQAAQQQQNQQINNQQVNDPQNLVPQQPNNNQKMVEQID